MKKFVGEQDERRRTEEDATEKVLLKDLLLAKEECGQRVTMAPEGL